MAGRWTAFWRDERGATGMEYALLGTLVAVALAGTFALLGDGLMNIFDSGAANVIANQTALLNP